MMKLVADPETAPSPRALVEALKPDLNKIFKPAFLGRMVVIPYYPVRDEALKQIIRLKLGKIQRRIQENHKIKLSYDDAFLNEVASRCTEVESGARNVDNILTNTLLPDISRKILGGMAEGEKMTAIHVGHWGAMGILYYAANQHAPVGCRTDGLREPLTQAPLASLGILSMPYTSQEERA